MARGMEVVEVGQQDDAFLFVGVGAGNDSDGAFRGAGVVGQVGHPGGMVSICMWMAWEPTVSAEIAGAYMRPCLPSKGSPARTRRQV